MGPNRRRNVSQHGTRNMKLNIGRNIGQNVRQSAHRDRGRKCSSAWLCCMMLRIPSTHFQDLLEPSIIRTLRKVYSCFMLHTYCAITIIHHLPTSSSLAPAVLPSHQPIKPFVWYSSIFLHDDETSNRPFHAMLFNSLRQSIPHT